MRADHQPRIVQDAARLLGDDVGGGLWERGWALADTGSDRDAPLQWRWPPTAPTVEPESPWSSPTRITQLAHGWQVDYGAAVAQSPARSEIHTDALTLLHDLERIESWPMPIAEARRLRALRIVELTQLRARGDDSHHVRLTEPYTSRLERLHEHQRATHQWGRRKGFDPVATPRQHASLAAQATLTAAEAWVSALRTARAGGRGWSVAGREQGGAS